MIRLHASPDVTIALVSFNNSRYIMDCLNSLYENTEGISFEVRIITNLASDKHLNNIRNLYPDVELTSISHPLSHSENNNLVLKNALGRYYLVLNDDTYFISNIVKEMVYFLDRHPKVGCMSPRIIYPDGRNQCGPVREKSFTDWCLMQLGVAGILHRMGTKAPLSICETKGCSGACVMVKREAWEAVSGFDEKIPVAPNDIDLARRIRKSGWQVFYYGTSTIVHIGSQTMSRNYEAAISMLVPSTQVFAKRYYNFAGRHLFRPVCLTASLWRAACFGLYGMVRHGAHGTNTKLKSKSYFLQCRLLLRSQVTNKKSRNIIS